MTTIAEALRNVKKLKGRIDEARARATASVNHYQDAPPAFEFQAQLVRADGASEELAELQGRLAVANATNHVAHKGRTVTLSHAVRILQETKSRIAWLKALAVKPQAQTIEMVAVYIPGQGHAQAPRQMECKLPEAQKAGLVDILQEEFDTLNASVETVNQKATV